MSASTQDDIISHPLTPMTVVPRKDVRFTADVNKHSGGLYSLKVYALPRDATNSKLICGLRTGQHTLHSGNYEGLVRNYMGVAHGSPALRASVENWDLVSWKGPNYGWVNTESIFQNERGALGAYGYPERIKRILTNDCYVDPTEPDCVSTLEVHFAGLKKPYAVEKASVHINGQTGKIGGVSFHNQNHPALGVCLIGFGGDKPCYQLQREPKDDASPYTPSNLVDARTHASIWEKLAGYGDTAAELCGGLGLPDVTVYNEKPMLMRDINDFGFDAVTGDYCPALKPTYKRLGIYFD